MKANRMLRKERKQLRLYDVKLQNLETRQFRVVRIGAKSSQAAGAKAHKRFRGYRISSIGIAKPKKTLLDF